MGILTVFASVFEGFTKDVEPKRERAGLHLVERRGRVGCLELIAAIGQVFLDEGELSFLLRVTHNQLGNGATEPIGHDGG
jgi:hypothetical protein